MTCRSLALVAVGALCLFACGAPDRDGDGYDTTKDCNDADAKVHPGATEVPYNGIDDDCDPSTKDDDLDGDGFGKLTGGDCNDKDPTIHPGADEIPYDGIDQDCSGSDLTDVDHDGHKAIQAGGDDCDDTRPDVHPGAVEICGDGIDQDCQGTPGDPPCNTVDHDGDGFSTAMGDCNDDDPSVHPGATEIPYNGKDDDCSIDTPDDDLDHDGFDKIGGGDCDDTNPKIHPGADEIPYDGIDQDCSGSDLIDVDHDGHPAIQAGGDDCDDTRPDVHPGGVDVCGDHIDQDCTGSDQACGDVDFDGDGFTPNQGDCNDANPRINPGATEIAYNGVDDDCSLTTPDDDLDRDGFNKMGGGDCNDNDATIFPGATEIPYDGIDQDCSGADLVDVDHDGYKAVQAGGDDCDDTRADVHPKAVDVCGDGIDQDCSGADKVCVKQWNGVAYGMYTTELNGWESCWTGNYTDSASIKDTILKSCTKGLLLTACYYSTNPGYLYVAAEGAHDDVLFDTGSGSTHTANGVTWYYDTNSAWGFVPEGSSVTHTTCDTATDAGNLRMCWTTANGSVTAGFRCGNYSDTTWNPYFTRIIYQADP